MLLELANFSYPVALKMTNRIGFVGRIERGAMKD
jgi:hypothetical protein